MTAPPIKFINDFAPQLDSSSDRLPYLQNYNLINIPPSPTFTPPSPVFPYPTNIPELYSNYIKNEYDLLNNEYNSINNDSQESINNLKSAINKFTTFDNDTIQNLIIQYAKPIINNTSPKSSVDPSDTSTLLSSLITTYLQTKRDYLRTMKIKIDAQKSKYNNDVKYNDDAVKWNQYVNKRKEYDTKKTAYNNSLIRPNSYSCSNGDIVYIGGEMKCTTPTTPPEPSFDQNIIASPPILPNSTLPEPITTQSAFETARTKMFDQLIVFIQVLASNPIVPVADSQTTLETNIATNLNDIVNNEIIIAKFPSTSTTNTTPAHDTAILTYINNHKIYIKKLIGNIATSQPAQQPAQQPTQQPAQQPASPRAQPAPQYTPPPTPPAEQDTASKADTKSDNKMYVIIAIIITIIIISLVVYFMMNKSDSGSVSSMKPIMTKKGGYYYFL